MPLTPAGFAIVKHRRTTAMLLTLSLRGSRSVTTRVVVSRLVQLPPARNGVPGALEPLAGDVRAFVSDGRRYVAFQQRAAVDVLDTLTGRRYARYLPGRCVQAGANALQDISFPMVQLGCESGSVLINATTGRLRRLPNPTGLTEAWSGIGRFWVGPTPAPNCPNFYVCDDYFNWRTGAIRRIDSSPTNPPPPMETGNSSPPQPTRIEVPRAEVLARDLDTPALSPVARCPPAQPSNLDDSLLANPQLYQPPYVLYGQAVDPMNGNPMNSAPYAPPGLVLGRCGTAMPTVLEAAATDVYTWFDGPGDQVGAGIVS